MVKWTSTKPDYVAKGFAQVEGLDFFETYAPTCKPETFRTLFSSCNAEELTSRGKWM